MKIAIKLEERMVRELVIDTDNYIRDGNDSDKVFEMAELINSAKDDPASFFADDMHSVTETRETVKTTVEKA